ncbi:winged helix-turn-helix domain-containing protein [Desulfobacca acetoxidans]|uniref:Putative transcriptional regulator, ModE family n=1 Tax=Desulfobacca acetoxidans (strain ATCC 700848 / DSM 11109 / ASRB2) TaxID=880072 RepID=F2NDR5_DESAR|nr:LysR family transcriptional regulator [Desulfobacca acetoxidans]AEB10412.1 putative transcriptional regulator, ModE family [Desulfobacca acetoxidans DSM 11109]HAY23055.1 hypothetical protein [Desulfobacterales bacterium]
MSDIQIHYKVWLEQDGEVLFGRGRVELLRGILEYGSLAETARKMGMSYRAAWGRLKSSEKRLGRHLVEKVPAEGRGQKLILTPLARLFIEEFLSLEQDMAVFCEEHKGSFLRLLRRSVQHA